LTETNLDLSPLAPPKSKSSSRRRTIGVLVVLVIAILALLSQGLLHSLNYFDTVDQVFASRAKIGTTTIRLEGVVKPHTITRTSKGASFWMTGTGTNEVYVISRRRHSSSRPTSPSSSKVTSRRVTRRRSTAHRSS
jgi:cytochrome c-type biogenesis protein CcmE